MNYQYWANFEYRNKYGSLSCTRKFEYGSVHKPVRDGDPYSFMYSKIRTRTRFCTQNWPNIGDSYGKCTFWCTYITKALKRNIYSLCNKKLCNTVHCITGMAHIKD